MKMKINLFYLFVLKHSNLESLKREKLLTTFMKEIKAKTEAYVEAEKSIGKQFLAPEKPEALYNLGNTHF